MILLAAVIVGGLLLAAGFLLAVFVGGARLRGNWGRPPAAPAQVIPFPPSNQRKAL